MNQTKNPTALQSQKWILQALLVLMKENNYDKISVSEICRKAELDRRTFYRNFDSKHDVLEQYIAQLSNEYMFGFQEINKLDKYYATLTFFAFWKKHLHFIRNMQNCGLSNYVFDQFKKFSESQQDLLIDKKEENTTTDYVLAFRIGGFWNVMLTWASHNASISPEELATIISQV